MAETKASWMTLKPEEIKARIIELAKQGISAEKIGLVLRDEQGIPKAKLLGIRIKKVLHEKNMWNSPETANITKKIETLSKHSSLHKHDYKGKRTLVRCSAQINTLKKM